MVPSSSLLWPSGIDAVKGVLGQRILGAPGSAMSYGNAAAIGYGVGAGTYGFGKAGEASIYGFGSGGGGLIK